MSVSWRDVPGYEGRYQVSSEGAVVSTVGRKPRRLKPRPLAKGKSHVSVNLYDGSGLSGRKHHLVHRLVLLAVVGPPPSRDHRGLHRNDVGDDNRLDNLYWGTDSDNQNDRVLNGYRHSEVTRQRISDATKGRSAWNKGRRGGASSASRS